MKINPLTAPSNIKVSTLLKTNVAMDNTPFIDDFPSQKPLFLAISQPATFAYRRAILSPEYQNKTQCLSCLMLDCEFICIYMDLCKVLWI